MNYATGCNPIPFVENGHVFTGDNFTRIIPHSKILEGMTGLKFIKCNLTNCDIPADAVTEYCTPKHIEFCSNLHPTYVDYGLTPCVQNCSHVTSVDTITIDGVVVDTVYYYEDKVVA